MAIRAIPAGLLVQEGGCAVPGPGARRGEAGQLVPRGEPGARGEGAAAHGGSGRAEPALWARHDADGHGGGEAKAPGMADAAGSAFTLLHHAACGCACRVLVRAMY